MLVFTTTVFGGDECASNPCTSGATCVDRYFKLGCKIDWVQGQQVTILKACNSLT